MLKTTLAALGIVLGAIIFPTTFVGVAQASCLPGFCDGGGDDGEGDGGASSQPPSSQEDNSGAGHGGPGGNGGDLEPVSVEEHIARLEKTCNAALQKLAQIPEKLVTSFSSDGSVSVIAVCNSGLGHQAEIDGSQALPLQSAIASNPAMAGALQQEGFHVEDVVGIVVANGLATLYVHRGIV
jgi:hypothetical protein